MRLCRLSLGFRVALVASALALSASALPAQTCITQANLAPEVRDQIANAALALAVAVQSGDPARVQALTTPEFAANFSQTATQIRTLGTELAADQMRVTHVFQLDATGRKPGDSSEADFSCPLAATASEADFSIPGLPSGMYAFAMVDAKGGPRPWMLSFLLQQTGATGSVQWKMAGFYPHEATVAGHDGLWFWKDARDAAKAKEPLTSWLLYGEADDLLRPANFATSTNLDKLRAERHAAMPPEIGEGISPATPLVVKSGSDEFRFTAIGAQPSDDGKQLILALHYQAPYLEDSAAARARNLAAAEALAAAHKPLRTNFDRVLVIADSEGHGPFVNDFPMAEVK